MHSKNNNPKTQKLCHDDIRIGVLVKADDGAGRIKSLLPVGFESFSITFGSSAEGIDIEKLAADTAEALAKTQARISSLGIYSNPLAPGDEGAKARRDWERLIETAPVFNTDIVAGFAGRIRGRPIPDSLERFREVFGELGEKAREKKLRIAFENCPMGGNWETGDMNIAINPAAWKLMFEILPHENLGLQWEPCHQMLQLIDPVAQLRKWAGRIFHLHGKCANIRRDLIKTQGIAGPEPVGLHRIPGFGDLDWKKVVSELRLAGFSGSIDVEGWHDPVFKNELEMTGQVYGLNYLKSCRGGEFIANPS